MYGIDFDTYHLFRKRCHQKSSTNEIRKRNCLHVCVKKSLKFKYKGIVLRNLVFVYAYVDVCVYLYICTCMHMLKMYTSYIFEEELDSAF